MSRPPALPAAAALLVVVLATTGCASPQERAQRRLAARPGLEATVARYEEMQARIRDGLTGVLGPRRWFTANDGGGGGCDPDLPAAAVRTLPLWTVDGGIPDADWPRARAVVAGVAAGYGFTTTGTTVDRPGLHDVTLVDRELDARIAFGAEVNTTMQVRTGCHLPEAARSS